VDAVTAHTKTLPLHKKNTDIGNKETTFSSTLYLEQEDAATLELKEEITLMDWGNVFVEKIQKDASGKVTGVTLKLHLEGDFRKTKKKLTWISALPPVDNKAHDVVDIELLDYDYLITKKKLEEEDNFEDFITPVSEFRVNFTKAHGHRLLLLRMLMFVR
jgi:glutamyl-tRNA synthetase